MKFSAPWLLAAALPLLSVSAFAAEYAPQNSSELQQALADAAYSTVDDRIILEPGTVYQTPGQPFAYTGNFGGSLTIESADPEVKAVLDGGGVTQVLVLSEANGGVSTQFTLNNLVIRNGLGSGESNNAAGLRFSGANAVIENSEFYGNTGSGIASAAAIYGFGGSGYGLVLKASIVKENSAATSTRASVIYASQLEKLHLTEGTLVLNNEGHYGVLKLDDSPTVIDEAVRFEGNTSESIGIINPDSGVASPVTITDAEFVNNTLTGSTGAGVLGYGQYQVSNSLFEGNSGSSWAVANLNKSEESYITNSRFIGNHSTGAGILKVNGNGTVLTNLLFEGNQASNSIEGIVSCARSCQVLNSLFTGNSGAALIYAGYYTQYDQTVVANSVVLEDDTPVLGFDDSDVFVTLLNNYLVPESFNPVPAAQLYQGGNITDGSDPGIDVANDYALLKDSQLIDQGATDSSQISLARLDIRGNPRVAGASVDIGWEEFGSAHSLPVITHFELLTTDASNLDTLQFKIEYEAPDVASPLIEFYSEDSAEFRVVELSTDGIFTEVLFDAGPQTVTVRVTGADDQYVEQDLIVELNALSTLELIDRVSAKTQSLCVEKPEKCGVDINAIELEGYNAGLAAMKLTCMSAPGECDIDIQEFVDRGKDECYNDPAACGIKVNQGNFDEQLIPSMGEGWELFGTGQSIADLQTVFGRDVQVVWARIEGEWQAWSPHRDTAQVLRDNQVAEIEVIPAHAGFWVRK